MAAAALDGKIYAMGGEIPRLFAVHEVYGIATDTWSTAVPMPLPRHGVAAVALDDRILVPAGGTVQGLAPTARVDAFMPQQAPAPADRGRFRFARFRAEETDATAQVTGLRQGEGVGEASVDYATSDGSAAAGLDYEPVAGTLRWADGDTSRKSFQVPLLDDGAIESEETVELSLSNPSGGELGQPAEAVVRITDGDRGMSYPARKLRLLGEHAAWGGSGARACACGAGPRAVVAPR